MNNKNFALMIQARANSKRLPNKILEKIDKKEVLVIMLKRLKKKFRNKIIAEMSFAKMQHLYLKFYPFVLFLANVFLFFFLFFDFL